MEKEIEELRKDVEMLKMAVSILLKRTGIIGEILRSSKVDNMLKNSQQDKSKDTHKEGEYNNILNRAQLNEILKKDLTVISNYLYAVSPAARNGLRSGRTFMFVKEKTVMTL